MLAHYLYVGQLIENVLWDQLFDVVTVSIHEVGLVL